MWAHLVQCWNGLRYYSAFCANYKNNHHDKNDNTGVYCTFDVVVRSSVGLVQRQPFKSKTRPTDSYFIRKTSLHRDFELLLPFLIFCPHFEMGL